MPMASVVLRRPDFSDEDTCQCKPFAESSDGHHRVSVYSGVNMPWVPHEGADVGLFLCPTPSFRKAAQVLSGPACLSSSAMSCDHFSSLCTMNLHTVGLQNLKKLAPPSLEPEVSPGILKPVESLWPKP